MPLVHDGELGSLRAHVAGGAPNALVLCGRRGSGRTWLLDRLQHDDPTGTVTARINPQEAHLALSGLTTVLTSLQEPRLAEFVGRFRLTDTSEEGVVAAASAVLGLLRSADLAPRVVLVDDLDRADAASRIALSFMANRLSGTGLRIVASVQEQGSTGQFSGFVQIVLGEWSPTDLAEIVATSPFAAADTTTVQIVVENTQPVPGAVLRQLRWLTPAQRAGEVALGIPLMPAYPDEVAQATEHVDDDALTILWQMASAPILSRPVAGRTALGAGHLAALAARRMLTVHQGALSVSDPAIRSYLYWAATAEERLELHAQLAVLEASHSDPLATFHASHLALESAESGDWPGRLFRAASSLLSRGEVRAATEVAERALGVFCPSARAAELDFAEDLARRGLVGRARRHLRAWGDPDDGRSQLRAATIEVLVSTVDGGEVADEELGVLAARWAEELPDETADLLAALAASSLERDDVSSARRRVDTALTLSAVAPPGSSRHWIVRHVTAVSERRATAEHGAAATAETVAATATSSAPSAPSAPSALGLQLVRGRALSAEEDYEGARADFAAVAGAHDGGGPRSPWHRAALVASIENDIRAGQVGRALARADLLSSWAEPRRADAHDLLIESWRAQMAGRFVDSAATLGRLRTEVDPARSSILSAVVDARLGTLELMANHPERAVDLLVQAARGENAGAFAVLRITVKLVQALAAVGDTNGARHEVERLRREHEQHPSRWTTDALVRCRVSIEDLPAARDAFAEYASSRPSSPLDLARTRAVWGARLVVAGETLAGDLLQTRAEGELTAMGAVGWLGALREREEPAVLAASGAEGLLLLDEQERAVLVLLRRGLRNKAIAHELYVSLRTVESRISRIYDKLGTRSRAVVLALPPSRPRDEEAGPESAPALLVS